TTSGSTITLYPVWEQSVTYMQGWTGCSALSESEQITLVDSRDQKEYTVKKLPDGKCWMMQNLTINGVELTSSDTNFTSGGPYYLPKDGGAGSLTASATKNATTGYNFANGSDNQAMFKFRAKNSSVTNDSDTGYYNFYTATLGYSYYGDGKTSGSSSIDICPKNWRLPWTSDSGTTRTTTADFYVLANSYNTSASWTNKPTGSSTGNPYTSNSTIKNKMYLVAASPLATSTQNDNAGFSYSGSWNGTDSSASIVGSRGLYWSSSVNNTNNGYNLYFSSSDVYPQYNLNKFYGYAVRCVAKDTMQETSATDLAESATTSLVDSRDNQSYTVYRWPSTGTAGTDYPTGMAGYAIMTKNLSLGYVTGGSVTKGSNLTLTTSDSAAAGTITARTSKSNWSTTNSDDNLQYINGTNATYGTHSYYSYGAAQKVCPKGWRPPTQTEYANIATFMGGDNSTGSSKIRGTPYNFVYGGYFYSSGWLSVGSGGDYWASTQYSSTNGYLLYFGSSTLNTGSRNKNSGLSVRCVSAP
ncbi:hypothetical protein IJ090_01170, partial [Candidatus Saccharibacteria bacterium]|nr:hypothetical protein [Candidatus Saccharibacteria bacterium]